MRGNIYFAKMPEQDVNVHSCESGIRPVVVVSSQIGNRTNNTVIVCPITTKIKHKSCNVDIEWSNNGKQSQVLCNQIQTIPKSILTFPCGYVTLEEQRKIDIALLISLGINIDYEGVKDYACKRKYVKRSI